MGILARCATLTGEEQKTFLACAGVIILRSDNIDDNSYGKWLDKLVGLVVPAMLVIVYQDFSSIDWSIIEEIFAKGVYIQMWKCYYTVRYYTNKGAQAVLLSLHTGYFYFTMDIRIYQYKQRPSVAYLSAFLKFRLAVKIFATWYYEGRRLTKMELDGTNPITNNSKANPICHQQSDSGRPCISVSKLNGPSPV